MIAEVFRGGFCVIVVSSKCVFLVKFLECFRIFVFSVPM